MNYDREVERLQNEVFLLRAAMAESLKLQSHYASLLNAYDGGERMQFPDNDSWLARLQSLGDRSRSQEWAAQQASQLNAECEEEIEWLHGKPR